MTILANVLTSLGLSSVQSASEILGAEVVASTNSTRYNYADAVEMFGVTTAEAIKTTLEQAGMSGAAVLYCGQGIDLSLPATQTGLASLATLAPALADAFNRLAAIGVTRGPKWEVMGLDSMPTTEAIQSALAENETRHGFTTMLNECVNPLVADDTTTIEQFKSAVANYGA